MYRFWRCDKRLIPQSPACPPGNIRLRPEHAHKAFIWFPWRCSHTDRPAGADILSKPPGKRFGLFHIGHQEQEVCRCAFALNGGKQKFYSQAPCLVLDVVGLIHHHQGQGARDFLIANNQLQFFRRRHQNIKCAIFTIPRKQIIFERIDLNGAGQLFNPYPNCFEVAAKTAGNLGR